MNGTALTGALGEFAPSIHPEAWVAPGAVVIGRVSLGRAASVWYGSVLRADEDEIAVGPECNVQDQCCLHVDPGEPVVLEEGVSLGHRAVVHGAYVCAGALVGIGAIVLGGARIGAGSLVAAGTVVRPGTQVPAGVLFAGVPGRIVRELTDADRSGFAGTAEHYVQRAARHRGARWGRPLAGRHHGARWGRVLAAQVPRCPVGPAVSRQVRAAARDSAWRRSVAANAAGNE
jgi:carbonic anhydrase/acetyltransferase-like protein (isoleucine patch superfamily)